MQDIYYKDVIKGINENVNDMWYYLGNFLDNIKQLNKEQLEKVFIDEPTTYNNINEQQIAMIGAIAHKISNDYELQLPMWVYNDKYFSKEPYFSFVGKTGLYKIILLQESPSEFRMRNLWVEANCLERA